MTGHTRRAALGLMLGGGVLTAADTLGFTTLRGDRETSVAVADDAAAHLGVTQVNGAQEETQYTNPHVVDLVNNTDAAMNFTVSRSDGTETVVVEDVDDATSFSDSVDANIAPIPAGESFPITLFHRNTGSVVDEQFTVTTSHTAGGLSVDLDRWVRINDPAPDTGTTSDSSGLGLCYDGLYGVEVQTGGGGTVAADGADITGWGDKGPLDAALGTVDASPVYSDVGSRGLENVVDFNDDLNTQTLGGVEADLTRTDDDIELTLVTLVRNPTSGRVVSLYDAGNDHELGVGVDLLTDDISVVFNYDGGSDVTYGGNFSTNSAVVTARIGATVTSGTVDSIDLTARLNGSQVGSDTVTDVPSDYSFSTALSVGVGGRQANGTTNADDTDNEYSGQVGEVLTYDVALSDTDLTSLEQYLETKWSGLDVTLA